jgi:large subunit ribosomal protein L15
MKLNEIRDNPGARKSRIRVGRGLGSGKGKTCGRGYKGSKSRSGMTIAGFEGGQMPLHMRIPKRGFNNIFEKDYAVINLGMLQKAVDAGKIAAGEALTSARLRELNLVSKSKDGVRVLAKGELKAALTLTVEGASKSAVDAVAKAGGALTVTAPAADAS